MMRFALSAFHSNIYHCDFLREKQYIAGAAAAVGVVAFVFYIYFFSFLVRIFSICEKISARERTKCSNEAKKNSLYISIDELLVETSKKNEQNQPTARFFVRSAIRSLVRFYIMCICICTILFIELCTLLARFTHTFFIRIKKPLAFSSFRSSVCLCMLRFFCIIPSYSAVLVWC